MREPTKAIILKITHHLHLQSKKTFMVHEIQHNP
jgi:hypothetical protein